MRSNPYTIEHNRQLRQLRTFLENKRFQVLQYDKNGPDLICSDDRFRFAIELKTGKSCSSTSYENSLRFEWITGIPTFLLFSKTMKVVGMDVPPVRITGSAYDLGKVFWF